MKLMVTVMVIKINKKRLGMGIATVMENQKTSKKRLATAMVMVIKTSKKRLGTAMIIKLKKKRLITVMGTAMEQETTPLNAF